MTKKIVIGLFSIFMFMAYGCAELALQALIHTPGAIMEAAGKGEKPTQQKPNEVYDLIEKHEIGENTVAIHMATLRYKPGYAFIACNHNKQILGSIFYHATDESDMREYNEFLKMNPLEKKQFIRKTFLRLSKVDLGPVEVKPDKSL